jgi:hypothetical protein
VVYDNTGNYKCWLDRRCGGGEVARITRFVDITDFHAMPSNNYGHPKVAVGFAAQLALVIGFVMFTVVTIGYSLLRSQ